MHLEGSLRPETVFRLAERNGIDVGASSPAELESRYQFGDFDRFLELFLTGLSVLQTGDDIADAVDALADDLSHHHVRYAEVTTTPFTHKRRDMDPDDYLDGLERGRLRARAKGVALAWIMDVPRELEPPDELFTARLAVDAMSAGVIGLGLGGPEVGYPPEMHEASFRHAAQHGLAAIPHAGETAGPESIWGALRVLGAVRVGHGVRCLEDPELVDHLRERSIPLEVCPTSNVLLGVSRSLETHPIGKLLELGLTVTVNTDDPAYFRTTLTDELVAVATHHDLDLTELAAMQRTAIGAARCDSTLKTEIADEIEVWLGAAGT